ncbi:MAG: tyrosine--tRNA ligase, partial [Myxococcales bacterium]
FLVGDTTAMVGDPTGRSDARPRLSADDIQAAAATYQAQAFKVLDASKTEVRFNSEWLGKMSVVDMIELTSRRTVARTLERRDFRERFEQNSDIYLHEFFYPLLQGYDSVALEADLELGGTDQLFNLNVGRDLMPRYGQPAQCVLTMPLLEGLDARLVDGHIVGKKMSKSAGNYVGIDEPPTEMFVKCMRIDDAVLYRYFDLLSSLDHEEVAALRAAPDPLVHKRQFAREIVRRFHGEDAALAAEQSFDQVRVADGIPDAKDIPEITVEADPAGLWIAKALAATGLAPSTSEGKRMVKNGRVEVDQVHVTDDTLKLPRGGRYLLRSGSKNRKFVYLVVPA